jgi:rhamnose transport system ATP-binding protein
LGAKSVDCGIHLGDTTAAKWLELLCDPFKCDTLLKCDTLPCSGCNMSEDVLLSAVNITKSYAGVQALKGVSFELRAGEVHALVGENGAGKSTLIKIITGAVEANFGQIKVGGRTIIHNSPRLAKSLGIAAIYQRPALFADLTVAENIALATEPARLWRRINWRERRRRAARLLAQIGAKIEVQAYAGELTMPQQQLVEIARALGANAKVLIMDEPTASLSQAETQNLFRVIRNLRAQGVGIIYISHRLEELPAIADRVTVLRDGCTVGTRLISQVSRQDLIQMMVGRQLPSPSHKKLAASEPCLSAGPSARDAQAGGGVVLELRHLGCRATGITDVNLSLRAGEILGLAGLVGAGRTELARTIFGLTPADEGEILLRGRRVRIDCPAQAIKCGIAYLPEDRQRHGVIPEMAISANMTLASLDRFSQFGRMDFQREKKIAAEYVQRLSIKTPAIFAPVATLSGGNQQKVALSRWLMTNPSVLILDEPTQGIDVGAKSEIHKLMLDLASQGVAILMISSELPEILGISDRIAVMRSGTIVGTLDSRDATGQKVLAMIFGSDSQAQA